MAERISLRPPSWKQYHLDIVGARIVRTTSSQLCTQLAITPAAASTELHRFISGIRAPVDSNRWDHPASAIIGNSYLLTKHKLDAEGWAPLPFVDSVIDYFCPNHPPTLKELVLRFGDVAVTVALNIYADGVLGFLETERPRGTFEEETAYCLLVAQNAKARNFGKNGKMRPWIIAVRGVDVCVVTAEFDRDQLRKMEIAAKEALGFGKQKTVATGFEVFVLKWDLTSSEGRAGFVDFMAGLLKHLKLTD